MSYPIKMVKLLIVLVAIVAGVLGQIDTHPNDSGRIIGGANAPKGDFRYQVSIRDPLGRHVCSGAIIKPTVIVTSAFCLKKRLPISLTVVVGTNKLGLIGGTKHKVAKLISHEKFQFPYNNIGLVILSSPIEYSYTAAPIKLPTVDTGAGVYGNVTGWGKHVEPRAPTKHLQYLSLQTIDNDVCQVLHAQTAMRILETEICTSNKAGEGACDRDEGAVLATKEILIGIYSWSENCSKGLPDVYTRVSSYIDWIHTNSM